MMEQRQFIKGLFAKKSKNEKFIDIGLKKKEFLQYIESLKEDEKGFIQLSMAEQKADASKYSVWVNDWKPSKTTKKTIEDGDDGDLPF